MCAHVGHSGTDGGSEEWRRCCTRRHTCTHTHIHTNIRVHTHVRTQVLAVSAGHLSKLYHAFLRKLPQRYPLARALPLSRSRSLLLSLSRALLRSLSLSLSRRYCSLFRLSYLRQKERVRAGGRDKELSLPLPRARAVSVAGTQPRERVMFIGTRFRESVLFIGTRFSNLSLSQVRSQRQTRVPAKKHSTAKTVL